MAWFKENWFRLIIVILVAAFVLTSSYDVWKKHHPYKNFREETAERLQKEIDRKCRSGEMPFADCIKLEK